MCVNIFPLKRIQCCYTAQDIFFLQICWPKNISLQIEALVIRSKDIYAQEF